MNGAPDADIALFTEALRLPLEERERYLSEACKGDAELRRRVEAWLQAYEQAGDFLRKPVAERPPKAAKGVPAGEKPGDRIGHYKLLQQLGEGGCGVVYMAEQEEPVRRRVALKIIKPGMDTKSVIARFEAERQALALMDHQSICHVFEAGATESRRPYFAMELVKGVKITDYCDRHLLSLDARLELFIQVCDAVQHAHQKGIIHRDIKPSNILVTTGSDRKPAPKVIDFGIAKAVTGQQLTDKTIFTAYEMLIGTPAYMSPEQAALAITDVDTRTDIYSLGVLLYELLTGTTPFETHELLKVGFDEVRRVIRDEEPVRPSTRLTTMTAADLMRFSKHYGAEGTKLIHEMRGDLDWIVMKALEKDRTRRYATANALAMDIQRHLAGEPVLACPPSRLYRFRKLVSRHKVEFAALGIVITTLVAGLSITTWSLAREKKAHSETLTEAGRRGEAIEFLKRMVFGVHPTVALGRDTSVPQEVLDRTVTNIDIELMNQPAVRADMKVWIGGLYVGLARADKAEPLLRDALDYFRKFPTGSELQISEALSRLSLLHITSRPPRLAEAEQEVQEALDIEKKLSNKPNMRRVVLVTRMGYINLYSGKAADAETIFRRALDQGQPLVQGRPELLLDTRGGLTSALREQGKLVEAEKLLRESLHIAQERLGQDHPYVANDMMRLAAVLVRENNLNEAEDFYRQCVAIMRKTLDVNHPLNDEALALLAEVLVKNRKTSDAEIAYRDLLNSRRRKFGEQDARVLEAVVPLAEMLVADHNESEFEQLAGQFPEAWAASSQDLARHGRWPEALAVASRLVELRPDNHSGYHLLAPLLVQTADRTAYEELCTRITTHFAGTTDPRVADRMAKDCLILPRPSADLKVPGKLAETAVTKGEKDTGALPFFQCCKALAEYRFGNWEGATHWANRAAANSSPYARAEANAILAMAQFQWKHVEDARDALNKCTQVVGTELPKFTDKDLGGDWRDLIIAHALQSEAKKLIDGEPSIARPANLAE